jgi:hypothetical protein
MERSGRFPWLGVLRRLPLRCPKVGEASGGLLMARPRRLERHSPVKLAIRVTDGLLGATEVEARLARLADRPTAVTLLEIEECLGIVGFGWLLEFLGHVSPARASSAYRWPHSSLRHTRIDGRGQRWSHPQFGGRLSPATALQRAIEKSARKRSARTRSGPQAQRQSLRKRAAPILRGPRPAAAADSAQCFPRPLP